MSQYTEEAFANRLKTLRKAKGWTQEKLVELTGFGIATIKNWESAKVFPNAESLIELCELFECSMDYLMGADDYKNKGSGFVAEYTGLSEEAINTLASYKKSENTSAHPLDFLFKVYNTSGFLELINYLLLNESTPDLLKKIIECHSKEQEHEKTQLEIYKFNKITADGQRQKDSFKDDLITWIKRNLGNAKDEKKEFSYEEIMKIFNKLIKNTILKSNVQEKEINGLYWSIQDTFMQIIRDYTQQDNEIDKRIKKAVSKTLPTNFFE